MRSLLFLVPLAFVACSASPQGVVPIDSGGGGDGSSGGGDGSSEGGDGGSQCVANGMCSGGNPSKQCVTTIDGKVTDTSGMPVTSLTVFVCGTDLCTSPLMSDSMGAFHITACEFIDKPAFKVISDPQWVPFAAGLTGMGPSYTVNTVTIVPLPTQGMGAPADCVAMPGDAGAGCMAASDLASSNVTLSLAMGATLKFDLEHTDSNSQMFRAASVDAAKLPLALSGTTVDMAFGLAPLNTVINPPAKLTVPNTLKWAANAAVDVFLDGTDTTVAMPPAPWGAWGPIGTAHVSADGMTVSTDAAAGSGLPEIAMVGFKLHM